MTATHRVGRKGSKPPSKSQHFSNFIILFSSIGIWCRNEGSCIKNSRSPTSPLTHCALCNHKQPSHFFFRKSTKKIKQSGLHQNLLHVFSKISFLRKISQPQRWQKTKILYISKASFIQDQRTTSTIILKILLWNRSTKRSTIKCILSLSSLIYFLYKILVTVASL